MITILSMVVGFLSSMAPEFMKRWQDKADKQHELKMLEMQISAQEKGYGYKADEVGVESYSKMVVSAHKEQADTLKGASRWVINMSASVRPVITYLFMLAFIGFEIAGIYVLLHPTLPWQAGMTFAQATAVVWGDEEMALFAGILAYWFGDRAMARRRMA